jgi:hypothetical protein
MSSLEQAFMSLSRNGSHATIKKQKLHLLSKEQSDVVWTLASNPSGNIELTADEVKILAEAATITGGSVYKRKTVVEQAKNRPDYIKPIRDYKSEFAAKEAKEEADALKAKWEYKKKIEGSRPPSMAKRKFDRDMRIRNTEGGILGGTCPNCNSSKHMRIKGHKGWTGWYCNSCKEGGSITHKKK